MTFVNNNSETLGNNTYFEVRWPTFDEHGAYTGSSSVRFGVDEPKNAKDYYKQKKSEGLKPVLVVVNSVQVLPGYTHQEHEE